MSGADGGKRVGWQRLVDVSLLAADRSPIAKENVQATVSDRDCALKRIGALHVPAGVHRVFTRYADNDHQCRRNRHGHNEGTAGLFTKKECFHW